MEVLSGTCILSCVCFQAHAWTFFVFGSHVTSQNAVDLRPLFLYSHAAPAADQGRSAPLRQVQDGGDSQGRGAGELADNECMGHRSGGLRGCRGC